MTANVAALALEKPIARGSRNAAKQFDVRGPSAAPGAGRD